MTNCPGCTNIYCACGTPQFNAETNSYWVLNPLAAKHYEKKMMNTFDFRGIQVGKAEFTPYEQPYHPINSGKIPHKCPVCEGRGTVTFDAYCMMPVACNACEGEGIVWST